MHRVGLRSNRATVDYLHTFAALEGRDIRARVGNPTGDIHAKRYLVCVGDEHLSAVGSVNGGENSHKLNREEALLTEMPRINARLK